MKQDRSQGTSPGVPHSLRSRKTQAVDNRVSAALVSIFETHLYNFEDSEADRKTFVGEVVRDYLAFLRRKKTVIPRGMEAEVLEELVLQVNAMLLKKIYGYPTIAEYRKRSPRSKMKRKAVV